MDDQANGLPKRSPRRNEEKRQQAKDAATPPETIISVGEKDAADYWPGIHEDRNRAQQGEAIPQRNMRQERDSIEDRFAQAEAEVRRLNAQFSELRDQWERDREQEKSSIKEDYEILKKAVLDFVIANGAVDVQVALLRARGDSEGDIYENLRRSLEEQANALHALRSLARTLQTSDRP